MRCFAIAFTTAIVLGLISPSLSFGQEASATTSSLQPAEVQTKTSRVYVFVEKRGFGHEHGIEANLLASTLVLGASESAGQLVFDMKSFSADTPAARKHVGLTGTTDQGTRATVTKTMKSSAVLNVKQYPTATFDVASAKATGQTSSEGLPIYQLDGQFTLHTTKRPLSVKVEVSQASGLLHVRGNFKIKQTTFGIKPYSKAFGAIGVRDELKIYGDLFVAPTQNAAIADIPTPE